jgi:hypothetical protein
MNLRKTLITISAAAVLGTIGLASAPQPASARVVCNREGDCWSTHSRYHYPRDLGVQIYSDRYARPEYRERRWRDSHRTYRDERHDRGYYKSGVWIQF